MTLPQCNHSQLQVYLHAGTILEGFGNYFIDFGCT